MTQDEYYASLGERSQRFLGAVVEGEFGHPEILIHPMVGDAVLAVYRRWERFCAATSPLDAAGELVELNNAMDGLVTWLPGYDYETGELHVEGIDD